MRLPGVIPRSARSARLEGLSCAVLKLDIEGDSAARRATFLELSACEEQRQFFILEGGDVTLWTTHQVERRAPFRSARQTVDREGGTAS